ncbi:MAG TPA: tail fiber domain-containing protein [Blastocatellia bacterium]|nr:tail fiber domain-containing protein [Blastocatellia bacterium]
MSQLRFSIRVLSLLVTLTLGAQAQSNIFTYQGKFTDAGQPANGNFDLQFKLFDAASGGTQQGASPVTLEDVVVTNGVFTVQLDFGAGAFPGAARFLEISVRPGASTGAFTLLTPRQPLQSTPYAVRSLSAASADGLSVACVGCVTDTQIGGLPAGNSNYVQNTNTQQTGSNFNISGNGTAGGTLSGNILNATTQFNLNNVRVLSNAGTNNLFVGANAGAANAGGASNVFVGAGTGGNNTTGNLNTFFGRSAGNGNISGASNSFFGSSTGTANTTGGNNTLVGASANVGAGNLDFATALGAGATVGTSNTIVLGRSGGQDAVSVPGLLTANGAGVTNLNAANIATGTLGTARGGTGLSAAGAAGNYLRSDGTNWTSAALQAADIPNGSGNYIQNTTSPQATSNFNISGTGTANILNAATQFNLNGQRILTANSLSFFAGLGAGAVATGGQNTYVGANAGAATTLGNFNSFFGFNAGAATVTEFNNSYFGARAGEVSHGFNSAFFGTDAGKVNNTGVNNTFIGAFAGIANTIGNNNVFVGQSTGEANTAGIENVFVGRKAGNTNTTGSDNTIIGTDADVGSNNLSNATALGSQALVTQSNSLVLGSINGVNGATAGTSVGIGTTAPADLLDVNGDIRVGDSGTNGCLKNNSGGVITGTCSSDLRFKQNVTAFPRLLNRFAQLRPVHFYWRGAEFPDKHFGTEQSYGLIAQEVEQVLPELVSTDAQGFKQVDYSKLPLLTIQAVKELKAQNDALQAANRELQQRLAQIERALGKRTQARKRTMRRR